MLRKCCRIVVVSFVTVVKDAKAKRLVSFLGRAFGGFFAVPLAEIVDGFLEAVGVCRYQPL